MFGELEFLGVAGIWVIEVLQEPLLEDTGGGDRHLAVLPPFVRWLHRYLLLLLHQLAVNIIPVLLHYQLDLIGLIVYLAE